MKEANGHEFNTDTKLPFFKQAGFKLVIGMLTLNSIMLALLFFATQKITNDSFKTVATQQLQETLQLNHNFLHASGEQLQDISESYKNYAHHMEILAIAIKTGEYSKVKAVVDEHLLSSKFVHFIVADRHGNVLYRTGNPGEYGGSIAAFEIVQNGLSGKETEAKIINDLNQFKIAVALPLYLDHEVAGLLIANTPINNRYISQIKGTSIAEFTIIRDRAVMGSSLKGPKGESVGDLPLPYLEYQTMLKDASAVLDARILGSRYLVMTKKIGMMDGNTPGSLMLAYPRSGIDDIQSQLTKTFSYFFIATIIATIFFTWVLSQRISAALNKMVVNVQNITNGYYGHFIPHDSKDEFGIMSSRIYTMGETIRNNREELLATVKSRTAELTLEINEHHKTENELLEQKEVAEFANRAKSDFLANMSHELRTPLNSIIGFSQMMETETFGPHGSEKYLEYSKLIKGSGSHLLQVISDILDLSKIEAKKETLNFENTDMSSLIKKAVNMVSVRAEEAGVTLYVDINPSFPLLYVDSIKMLQILLNLLSNSIKFTPGGAVKTQCLINDNGECVLSVSDTGKGIAKEDLELVMEPFGQSGDPYQRSHEGTGLGLALVNSLTLLHGGYVTIESELDVGTTVTVIFPAECVTTA